MAFVCGVVHFGVKLPWLAKGQASWPFGRVELHESDLLAYTPLFPRRVWSLRVPYGEISEAVVRPSLLGGEIRLHRSAPSNGDVTIATLGDSYVRIADLLSNHGVDVTRKPGRLAKPFG